MKNFFGAEDEVFLDKNTVKILDGIAGSAKSSNVDKILREHGVTYGRYTSTNKLKRDAQTRYGGHNFTIAGGLFKTIDNEFFAEERSPEFDTVVIDEILQTDSRVLTWIEGNVGKKNIIVCTDTHQMLSPEMGQSLIKKFNEFCEREFVLVIHLDKTYRARTEETERYYHECYNSVDSGKLLYYRDRKKFPVIPFQSMDYNHDDIYICHTNSCENYLFETKRIMDDYDAPLIPKGAIAKRVPTNIRKYPILSQENTRGKRIGYFQPEHVGTPTRYQGSEVVQGQKLYYLVEKHSKIEPREWYTVISRLYDIRDLVIVMCDIPKHDELKTYNGKPVKTSKTPVISGDVPLSGGKTLRNVCESVDGKTVNITYQDMELVLSSVTDTDNIHFHRDKCIFGNKKIMVGDPEKQPKISNKSSMSSLLNKEPDFDYKYMPEFMRSFEIVQMKSYGRMLTDTIKPIVLDVDESGRDKKTYRYGLDLKSSYPCILKNATLPVGSVFYPSNGETGLVKTGKIDWYFLVSDGLQSPIVCTGEIAEKFMREGWRTFQYIGTSECKTGSRMGDLLYEMSFRSVESNQKRKEIHYGLMDRPWISPIDYDKKKEPGSYVVNFRNNHQLLMVSIRCAQASIIMDIKQEIYGNWMKRNGKIICDCIYFDYDGDIQELGDRIKNKIPGCHFRIFENSEQDKNGNVLYQTYENLKTEREIKRERDRERISRKRAEQKTQE